MAGDINGAKLRAQRVKRGLSQNDLANLTEGRDSISEDTIGRIERSGETIVNAQTRTARSLATALGIEIDKLR